ncbi:probable receptor-like protein kinase At5g20050 [Humulus lupulus]|uniref:probable receptor-like protein kinase At5g20050 n=1 Tax=Humulus lupulus TaxID=3486 RepID=UPI002B40C3AC|nr:probable receptor-like protein kinase At5g20050 [Humulus lupulus]
MEDKAANIVAVSTVLSVLILIIVTGIALHLSKAFFLICGAGISVIIAVFIWLIIRHNYNRSRKQLESKHVTEGRELRIEYSFLRKVAGVPTKFRFKEIEEATDNFQALLGRGGSATVFKGILADGTAVAVKCIDSGGSDKVDRGEKEFRSEVAAIASVQHVNLVRLLGYCTVPGRGPRYLVYDFIANGSLDGWIFPPREEGTNHPNRNINRRSNRRVGCLCWDLRYRVARDVAKALAYLHHDCRSRVLHLDVKPENILLDESFHAIVADFGLSRLMGKDESQILTTIRGTRGYLAPEWILEHGISEKSDVYSYGMVLIEMIGGRRNTVSRPAVGRKKENSSGSKKWEYFPKILNEKMRQGKIMEVVDRRLMAENGGRGVDEKELMRLAYVALWCIQERARVRPSMAQVLEMLEGRVAVEEPPDTKMVVVDLLSIDDDDPTAPHLAAFSVRDKSNHNTTSSIYSSAMSVLSCGR